MSLQLFDLTCLHLVLRNLSLVLGLCAGSLEHAYFNGLLVLLLGQLIDLLKQLDVVFHQRLLVTFVFFLTLHHLLFYVLYVVFKKITFFVYLHALSTAFGRGTLLKNVLLVKRNQCYFEFLVVINLLYNVPNVVAELLLELLLVIDRSLKPTLFVDQTGLAHFQVLNDQRKVLVHFCEMLHFLLHCVS